MARMIHRERQYGQTREGGERGESFQKGEGKKARGEKENF